MFHHLQKVSVDFFVVVVALSQQKNVSFWSIMDDIISIFQF
tara:strand:- start:881 stop:1003 length:123 start_codon:yes stop_codon:yes gene_type:complete